MLVCSLKQTNKTKKKTHTYTPLNLEHLSTKFWIKKVQNKREKIFYSKNNNHINEEIMANAEQWDKKE